MPMTEQAPAPAPVPAPVPADRPAHGPRSESAVLSVPSVVTRSSLKARQNSMVPEGQNEGPRNQALYDKKCESMMHQVANMDYPGNILKVLRKPSAQSSNVADSGVSKSRAGSDQPTSPEQGAGGSCLVLERRRRLDIRSASQLDNSVVQDNTLTDPSPHQTDRALAGLSPSLGQYIEVGLPAVRRSTRQRSHISHYQAGSGGMEGSSDRNT